VPLRINPDQLDFGTVWEQENFSWSIVIENKSAHEVIVEHIAADCSCTRVEPRNFALQAGEARNVRLTINLFPKANQQTAGERPFDIQIAALTGGQNKGRANWRLKGVVRSALKLQLREIDLGRPSELAERPPEGTIRLQSLVPLKRVFAKTDSEIFDAKATPSAEPGYFDLHVWATAKAAVGSHEFRVTLTPVLPGGDWLPDLKVQAYCEVRSDIQVMPEGGLVFGPRHIGADLQSSLTVRSLTGKRFEVLSVTTDLDDTGVDQISSSPSQGCSYVVRQRIRGSGEQQGTITVKVNSDGRDMILKAPISYYGLSAD
jgi:Protein of unknown function (DUF1573)